MARLRKPLCKLDRTPLKCADHPSDIIALRRPWQQKGAETKRKRQADEEPEQTEADTRPAKKARKESNDGGRVRGYTAEIRTEELILQTKIKSGDAADEEETGSGRGAGTVRGCSTVAARAVEARAGMAREAAAEVW